MKMERAEACPANAGQGFRSFFVGRKLTLFMKIKIID